MVFNVRQKDKLKYLRRLVKLRVLRMVPDKLVPMNLSLNSLSIEMTDDVLPEIRRHVWAGAYEAEESKILERIMGPDDVLLDCGCAIGYLIGIGANVSSRRHIAIDANPVCVDLTKSLLRANNLTNVDTLNGILSVNDSEEDYEFYVSDQIWSSSTEAERFKDHSKVTPIKVPKLSIERLCNEYGVTILSLDIEGGEYDLFHNVSWLRKSSTVRNIFPALFFVAHLRALRRLALRAAHITL